MEILIIRLWKPDVKTSCYCICKNHPIWKLGEFFLIKNLIIGQFPPTKKYIYMKIDQVLITSWENYNQLILKKKWELPNTIPNLVNIFAEHFCWTFIQKLPLHETICSFIVPYKSFSCCSIWKHPPSSLHYNVDEVQVVAMPQL
jgi:hypothetical protein